MIGWIAGYLRIDGWMEEITEEKIGRRTKRKMHMDKLDRLIYLYNPNIYYVIYNYLIFFLYLKHDLNIY